MNDYRSRIQLFRSHTRGPPRSTAHLTNDTWQMKGWVDPWEVRENRNGVSVNLWSSNQSATIALLKTHCMKILRRGIVRKHRCCIEMFRIKSSTKWW